MTQKRYNCESIPDTVPSFDIPGIMFTYNSKRSLSNYRSIIEACIFLCVSLVITYVLFQYRISNITTHYAMPDIDTDGGLWYKWLLHYSYQLKSPINFPTVVGFPFGYDFTQFPFFNLSDYIQWLIVEFILGYSPQSLIFVNNIFSLIVFPISALAGYIYCKYITGSRIGSIICGIFFAFSPYSVLMARGQMGINHFYFLPICLLSVHMLLKHRSINRLYFLSFTYGIQFAIDPYYCFFGIFLGALVVLFWLFNNINVKNGILVVMVSISVAIGIISLNMKYISDLSGYMFTKSEREATGRVEGKPENSLLPTTYYFGYPYTSYDSAEKTHHLIVYFGFGMPLIVSVFGALFLRTKEKVLYIFCVVAILLLSSTITPLLFVNEQYFRYFGMFRGVSRLALFYPLFAGIILSFAIKEIPILTKGKNILLLLLLGIYLGSIYTYRYTNTTLSTYTDWSARIRYLTPVAAAINDAKAVITYPIDNIGKVSMLPTLLDQTILEKPLAGGVDRKNKKHLDIYNSFSDISKPDTVLNLAVNGIDTIMIYNQLQHNSEIINDMLKNDERLTYVGTFVSDYNPGIPSLFSKTMDSSVYRIDKDYFNSMNTKNFDLVRVTTDKQKIVPNIVYQSPYRIVATLVNPGKINVVELNRSHSEGWNMSVDYKARVVKNENNSIDNSWQIFLGRPPSDITLEFIHHPQQENLIFSRMLLVMYVLFGFGILARTCYRLPRRNNHSS